MMAPEVVGRVERRLLLDHAADPGVAARHLPAGLEPRLLDGRAVVGVCLIRLAGALLMEDVGARWRSG